MKAVLVWESFLDNKYQCSVYYTGKEGVLIIRDEKNEIIAVKPVASLNYDYDQFLKFGIVSLTADPSDIEQWMKICIELINQSRFT